MKMVCVDISILFLDLVRVIVLSLSEVFFIWSDIDRYIMTSQIKVCTIKKKIMGNQTKTLMYGVCVCMCVCVYMCLCESGEILQNIQHK